MKEINLLINRIRIERGLNQTQLAKLLGVNFITVNRWVKGHNQPDLIHLEKLRELSAVYEPESSKVLFVKQELKRLKEEIEDLLKRL